MSSSLLMDLRELECLVAIADTGGVTRAAAALGVTQPAVSGAVRRLERELGEPLLEPAGRGVRLTAAGRAALAPARDALEARERVTRAVVDLTGLVLGEVRLGHVGSGATTTLLDPITHFHRAFPGVEVSLVEDRSDVLLRRLRDGALDLAWVGHVGALPAGIKGRRVVDERVVLGVGAAHPLAARRSVDLDTAIAHPLIALPVGTGARAALDDACAARGRTARIAFECSAPDLLARLAAGGLGVAVVPEPLARSLGLGVVVVREPAMRSRLTLAWASGGPSNPAARAFLEAVGSAATARPAPRPEHR